MAGNESDCDVRRVPEMSAKTSGGVQGLSHTQDKAPTGSSHRKRGGASADKEHKRLKRSLLHLMLHYDLILYLDLILHFDFIHRTYIIPNLCIKHHTSYIVCLKRPIHHLRVHLNLIFHVDLHNSF